MVDHKDITSEHAIVFWNSARVDRSLAHTAFDAAGYMHAVPKPDYTAAIRRTATSLVKQIGGEGTVKTFPLSGREQEVGVEVRRFVKGAKRNDLPFVFSLGVTEQHEVVILDVEPGHSIDTHREKMTELANELWRDAIHSIEAADLTEALSVLIQNNYGFLLRDGGGVWYLPTDNIQPYETVAKHLASAGVRLSAVRFSPVVNDALLDTVGHELMRRAQAVVDGTIDEVAEAVAAGKRIRPNGKATRLDTILEAEQMVAHNATLIGAWGEKFRQACEVARHRIAEAALGAFSMTNS